MTCGNSNIYAGAVGHIRDGGCFLPANTPRAAVDAHNPVPLVAVKHGLGWQQTTRLSVPLCIIMMRKVTIALWAPVFGLCCIRPLCRPLQLDLVH